MSRLADEPTDQELMARIGQGDHAAFLAIHARYARLVTSVALRVLHGSVADAEDVAQVVFTTVLEEPEKFDVTRGSLSALLHTVTRNHAVNLIRGAARRRKRERPTELLDDLAESEESAPSQSLEEAEEAAEQAALRARLHEAVRRLPEKSRAAVLMRVDGVGYDRIADVLGVTRSNARLRVHRGVKLLKAALASPD